MGVGSASGNCVAGSLGGSLTELTAKGHADIYLTLNANVTFWRGRYNKHTNFAMESLEQAFNTQVMFGGDAQCNLNRTGDLIYFMYAVIDLPGITAVRATAASCGTGGVNQFPWAPDACDACCDGDAPRPLEECADREAADLDCDLQDCERIQEPWAHWTNAVGQFLIKRACLVIGGQIIDTLYNHYLFMWEELSGKPGKRLTEMIGKRKTREELIEESAETRRLYVPLPFWFTQHSGNALPLVSLQFHGIQIHLCFEELRRCIQVSGENVQVLKTSEGSPITAQDLHVRLDTTYVYLDVTERDRFATGSFEQLIHQVQQFSVTTRETSVRLQLNFNHPMIELIWAVQRRCQEVVNNHFNYAGKYGRDPIEYVHLRLNNLPRFAGREATYFRLVQPYQFHTNIPDAFVYCFSFALHPEAPQPSGSCNFSRIDNVEMIFDLQQELHDFGGGFNQFGAFMGRNTCADTAMFNANADPFGGEVTIHIYGRNWNIFRYREGLAGRAFHS